MADASSPSNTLLSTLAIILPDTRIAEWVLHSFAPFLPAIIVLYILFKGRHKLLNHIPILSYGFSFGFIATIIGLYWTISIGALNKQGEPMDETGRFAAWIIHASMDFDGELLVICCFLLVFIGPQIMSYAISGMFGRAARLYLVDSMTKFAVWSLIKTTATGSGILLGIMIILWSDFWEYMRVSLLFILSSLLVTTGYSFVAAARQPEWFDVVHAWSTRNRVRGNAGTPC